MISKQLKESSHNHKIIGKVHSTEHSIYATVQSCNSGELYTPYIHYGDINCGCQKHYYSQKICSHVMTLLNHNPKFKEKVFVGEKMIPEYIRAARLKAINRLMGGIPVGSPVGIYGKAQAGKTILAFQLLFEVLNKNPSQNAIVVDTEGSSHTLAEWHPKFNKRYKMESDLVFIETKIEQRKVGRGFSYKLKYDYTPKTFKSPAIFILDLRSIEKLLAILGNGANIEMSKNGKISLKADQKFWVNEIESSPMYKILDDNNVKGMMLDSISYPLQIFGVARENFPSRAQAASWIMSPLHLLTEERRMCTFITAHESSDPADAYARPSYTGGKAVMHSIKFMLYISEKATSKTPRTDYSSRDENTRELWNQRHASKPPWKQYQFIKLTSSGYRDINVV